MAFNVDESKLCSHFYIPVIKILCNGEIFDLSSNDIGLVGCMYDFKNNFFPILHIKVFLTHSQAFKIRENNESVLVKLVITTYNKKIRSDSNAINLNNNTFLNQNFQPFNIDNNYYTSVDDSNSTVVSIFNKEDDSVNKEEMELFLFSVSSLNYNKKNINAILSNCTITDGILYSMEEVNIKKALISKPENDTKFSLKENSDLILPPMNFKKTIDCLQNVYGIYKSGSIQFMDFDRYYLLDADFSKDLPIEKNEYENVFINLIENTEITSEKVGCYEDKNQKCYVINTIDNSIVEEDNNLIKEGIGDGYKIMSPSTIKDSVTYNADTDKFSFNKTYNDYFTDINSQKDSNTRTSLLYNDIDNEYLETSLVNEKLENCTTITIEFSNVDLNFFKLNHKFYIQYNNNDKSKYNGIYRLSHFSFSLKGKNDFYEIAVFKKIIEI